MMIRHEDGTPMRAAEIMWEPAVCGPVVERWRREAGDPPLNEGLRVLAMKGVHLGLDALSTVLDFSGIGMAVGVVLDILHAGIYFMELEWTEEPDERRMLILQGGVTLAFAFLPGAQGLSFAMKAAIRKSRGAIRKMAEEIGNSPQATALLELVRDVVMKGDDMVQRAKGIVQQARKQYPHNKTFVQGCDYALKGLEMADFKAINSVAMELAKVTSRGAVTDQYGKMVARERKDAAEGLGTNKKEDGKEGAHGPGMRSLHGGETGREGWTGLKSRHMEKGDTTKGEGPMGESLTRTLWGPGGPDPEGMLSEANLYSPMHYLVDKLVTVLDRTRIGAKAAQIIDVLHAGLYKLEAFTATTDSMREIASLKGDITLAFAFMPGAQAMQKPLKDLIGKSYDLRGIAKTLKTERRYDNVPRLLEDMRRRMDALRLEAVRQIDVAMAANKGKNPFMNKTVPRIREAMLKGDGSAIDALLGMVAEERQKSPGAGGGSRMEALKQRAKDSLRDMAADGLQYGTKDLARHMMRDLTDMHATEEEAKAVVKDALKLTVNNLGDSEKDMFGTARGGDEASLRGAGQKRLKEIFEQWAESKALGVEFTNICRPMAMPSVFVTPIPDATITFVTVSGCYTVAKEIFRQRFEHKKDATIVCLPVERPEDVGILRKVHDKVVARVQGLLVETVAKMDLVIILLVGDLQRCKDTMRAYTSVHKTYAEAYGEEFSDVQYVELRDLAIAFINEKVSLFLHISGQHADYGDMAKKTGILFGKGSKVASVKTPYLQMLFKFRNKTLKGWPDMQRKANEANQKTGKGLQKDVNMLMGLCVRCINESLDFMQMDSLVMEVGNAINVPFDGGNYRTDLKPVDDKFATEAADTMRSIGGSYWENMAKRMAMAAYAGKAVNTPSPNSGAHVKRYYCDKPLSMGNGQFWFDKAGMSDDQRKAAKKPYVIDVYQNGDLAHIRFNLRFTGAPTKLLDLMRPEKGKKRPDPAVEATFKYALGSQVALRKGGAKKFNAMMPGLVKKIPQGYLMTADRIMVYLV